MSSRPGHLNEEKNPLVHQGGTASPPSPAREWNTDVSSGRLLGMNVGCSNELTCLQDMLICKAGCNHAYDPTVWRFHPESSRNTNRVKPSAAKAKKHEHEAGVICGGCRSHQRPSLPVTVFPPSTRVSAVKEVSPCGPQGGDVVSRASSCIWGHLSKRRWSDRLITRRLPKSMKHI